MSYEIVNYEGLRHRDPSSEFEKLLWLAVVRQAQWDSEGRGAVDRRLRYLAIRWLTKLTKSFLTVCSLAGMSTTQAIFLQETERKKYEHAKT